LRSYSVQWLEGVKTTLAGLIIGTMTVVFVVSKAALVFSGPLSPYLSHGLGFVLIGSTVMACVALLSAACRSVIVQPQDVTTVMVASAAGSLMAGTHLTGDTAFATVVVLVALSTVLAGLSAYLIGHFKLAYIVRYVPSPVTAGFLAASGLLLVREAFGIVLPAMSTQTLSHIATQWPVWLPWLAIGTALAVLVRRYSNGLVVPGTFFAAGVAFYLALPALGLDLDAARGQGWLLGPFQLDSLWVGPSLSLWHQVQWQVLPAAIPMVLAVVGLCLLGAMLNVITLEMMNRRESDLNGTLKSLGVANVAAGLCGGLSGYHMVSMTTLSRRMGISGVASGLSIVCVGLLCLVFGADFLSDLPRGLVAGIIWYLGVDLLLAALWDYGRRIPWRDLVLVLGIPLVSVTLGVLPALGLGLLAVCLMFVVVYAQIDAVRLFTTAAHLRARVERSPQQREYLRQMGDRIHVYKLSGYLFFGSAQRLLDRLQGSLQTAAPPRVIVVDLKRVTGLDLTAWNAFERLSRRCAEDAVKLVLTPPSAPLQKQFERQLAALQHADLPVNGDLDAVLTALEDLSLAEARLDPPVLADAGFAGPDSASPAAPAGTGPAGVMAVMQRHGQLRRFAAGHAVLHEGDASDSILMLVSGLLDVSVRQPAGPSTTINRLLPGALIGEVGFYAQGKRSASITAAADSEVLMVSTEQIKQMELHAPADAAQLHRALARVVAERLIAATLLLRDADA
jgi:SulP family sulfate permease